MIARVPLAPGDNDERVLQETARAINTACIYFPKKIQCLGRAAAMTRMLRRKGIPASFVIGVRPLPFAAHAWVEVNGQLAYGGTDLMRHFQVIDRT